MVALFQPADGSTAITLNGAYTPAQGTPVHVAVSWVDWDGSNAGSGEAFLYVNNSLADSDTHSKRIQTLSQYVYLGCDADGTKQANGWFNDLFLDPVFTTNTGTYTPQYPTSDYYSVSEPPQAWNRTLWKCVLDPRQKGEPCRLVGNVYRLNLNLIESR